MYAALPKHTVGIKWQAILMSQGEHSLDPEVFVSIA